MTSPQVLKKSPPTAATDKDCVLRQRTGKALAAPATRMKRTNTWLPYAGMGSWAKPAANSRPKATQYSGRNIPPASSTNPR